MPHSLFHPAVAAWFSSSFDAPTEVQRRAWKAIAQKNNTLIAAPTGSGKTLAAFLAAIDTLVREGLAQGLCDETRVLYVSPLKALSNDIQKNLQHPLNGIRSQLVENGFAEFELTAIVRTGDTTNADRNRMKRKPPHILVTTPESLYILLTSASGRTMLETVTQVIVDEIHALAGSKRGSHLMLSLERLSALCPQPPQRIGLSATQKPIEEIAAFLTGKSDHCTIIDTGHVRQRDLAIEVPRSPLQAIMANEVWDEVYDRLAELINAHQTTLIFVNTRRLAERAARFLGERIGEEHVTAHHGSLAREHRLNAEQRLKSGELKALIATASLELGIDIGDVDLVCQLGSSRTIAGFLQRVGRSGHAVNATPKGRLFPLSRDDLVECTALLDAIRHGELDHILIPEQPLDVLAQHIVAEVANQDWNENALYQLIKQAWPYRNLQKEDYSRVVIMLADGFSTRRGRRSAYLHRDAVHGQLRPRRNARLTALMNGGAIPDQFDYDVVLSPEGYIIGSLNEDFAFESLPGDIFQLGNTSYRILKIEQGKVNVEDAKGQPPNIPFWFGEAPGRSDELSFAVSRLRQQVNEQLKHGLEATTNWLTQHYALPVQAAQQLNDYLAAAKAALTVIPTQEHLVFERFFDESGDMHFVIHAPFGSRLNRAWGLALRKRFCRRFNFELQAAATEDNVILSLGPTHSFPLEEVKSYLNAKTVKDLLIQALLDAPMFATRWRWNASIALAVQRVRNGKRVPAQFQRTNAEDLIAVVFPDQLACFENLSGDREVPDHPLVNQTIHDCLHDTMDIDALEQLLTKLEHNTIEVIAKDVTTPSPLALEILNARPYAFLDDAPAEERRTLNVQQRRHIDPESAADLGRLDPLAIERVRQEAWPDAHNPDELHDALYVLGFIAPSIDPISEQAPEWFNTLKQHQRACEITLKNGQTIWTARERLAEILAGINYLEQPSLKPLKDDTKISRDEAIRELVRSRLEGLGPVTIEALAKPAALDVNNALTALLALEQEGFAIRGYFTQPENTDLEEWCERGLLARINRYTLKQLRSDIQAVPAADFMRFLFHWQRLTPNERGEGDVALLATIEQLEGFPISAAAWENHILPARIRAYVPSMLSNLCSSGQVVWLRPNVRRTTKQRSAATPVKVTPIVLLQRTHLYDWLSLDTMHSSEEHTSTLSAAADQVRQALQTYGASFLADLLHTTGLLRAQLETALGELVAAGLITADNFSGLRTLITPSSKKRLPRQRGYAAVDNAGRWSLIQRPQTPQTTRSYLNPGDRQGIETVARSLLRRYGVVFRKLLERENQLPPWRELLYFYRRLEARGEIRGGRFVQGFSGEQFALPEAAALLQRINNNKDHDEIIAICAADPLNLTGIITPGKRIAATIGNRVLYKQGVPIAHLTAGEVEFSQAFDAKTEWHLRQKLIREY